MNYVCISGNLTRDVETRFTGGGLAIGNFGVASTRKWNQNGEKKEETTFLDVTAFGKQAETIAQYFKKGSKILLTGRLSLDQWDDKKTGEKRSKIKVVLETFEFMGGKRDEAEAPQRGIDRADLPKASTPTPGATAALGDDVPFRLPQREHDFGRLA